MEQERKRLKSVPLRQESVKQLHEIALVANESRECDDQTRKHILEYVKTLISYGSVKEGESNAQMTVEDLINDAHMSVLTNDANRSNCFKATAFELHIAVELHYGLEDVKMHVQKAG